MIRLIFGTLALLTCLVAALPTPLSGSASNRLYGDDCSEWCFTGTDVLQPEVFGTSNQFCPDSRGCNWQWHLSFSPCSLSLLAFDALVGPNEVLYSDIDPAAAGSTQIYCSQSDGGVVLELRPHASPPIMTWHYRDTTCAELLADFAARDADFVAHEVGVSLGGDDWFANGATRLEDEEIDCAQVSDDDLAPCQQCFRGVEEPSLPAYGWEDVCGAQASTCQVSWQFCYDVCTDTTSKAAVHVGSSTLRAITGQRALAVQCGEKHGRTVLALTDAESIDALDAGQAHAYVAWEYRAVECEALMRAPRRHTLFVERHFAVERQSYKLDNGTLVEGSMLQELNIQVGGLDERTWVGHNGVSSEHGVASSTQVAFIVLVGILTVCCLIGWMLAFVQWWRATKDNSFGWLGSTSQQRVGSDVPAASMWGDKTPLAGDGDDTCVEDRRAQLQAVIDRASTVDPGDMSHLWTDPQEQRKARNQRQTEADEARLELNQLDQ